MIALTDNSRVLTICDGQFGSTGKGLIAAAIGQTNKIDIATTNASANAGHTACWEDGRKIIVCHLPMAGVVNTDAQLYINAGAIIDEDKLLEEIEENGVGDRLMIHPNAAIIEPWHKATEKRATGVSKLGSTQKGVGAALRDKVMRAGKLARDCPKLNDWINTMDLNERLKMGARVVMEVPQGFSLGYHSEFYPYCTSRQCTPAQGFADAQISPYFMGMTIMTLRTYPIRVGGPSGGWYKDQEETTWEEIGQTPELTTVTKRIRRVATFSWLQYRAALAEIRPDVIFSNFMNYLSADKRMVFSDQLYNVYQEVLGYGKTPMMITGYGPNVEDVR